MTRWLRSNRVNLLMVAVFAGHGLVIGAVWALTAVERPLLPPQVTAHLPSLPVLRELPGLPGHKSVGHGGSDTADGRGRSPVAESADGAGDGEDPTGTQGTATTSGHDGSVAATALGGGPDPEPAGVSSTVSPAATEPTNSPPTSPPSTRPPSTDPPTTIPPETTPPTTPATDPTSSTDPTLPDVTVPDVTVPELLNL